MMILKDTLALSTFGVLILQQYPVVTKEDDSALNSKKLELVPNLLEHIHQSCNGAFERSEMVPLDVNHFIENLGVQYRALRTNELSILIGCIVTIAMRFLFKARLWTFVAPCCGGLALLLAHRILFARAVDRALTAVIYNLNPIINQFNRVQWETMHLVEMGKLTRLLTMNIASWAFEKRAKAEQQSNIFS